MSQKQKPTRRGAGSTTTPRRKGGVSQSGPVRTRGPKGPKVTVARTGSKKTEPSPGGKSRDPMERRIGRKPPAEGAPTLGEMPRRKRPVDAPLGNETQGVAGPSDDVRTSVSSVWEGDDEGASYDTDNAYDDAHFSDPYPHSEDMGMLGIGSPFFPPDMGLDSSLENELEPQETGGVFPLADDPSVEMRIREIEERLDGLMAAEPHDDLDVAPPPPPEVVAPSSADTAVDAAREVLESNYYRQKWGRGSLTRTQEVDEFGMDPDYEERLKPLLEFMFKTYFRVDVEGIRHVPAEGRAVVVANHSGALPFDGVMLREAIRERHPGRADLRWLAEDFSFYLPFLGVTLNRIGAVRACPENAERLLAKEHLVGVFPEGAEGIKKLYKNRYRLQRFGRGGFVRLCLKTRSPIIPCAIVGAEETNPILYRFDNLSKLIGLDYLPITPTFPLLGPLGLLPAPTKWRIVFGEPISMDEYGPEAAQDHVLVGRLSERVRSSINDLLETALRRRKSVWL